jgi:hypothetical protein
MGVQLDAPGVVVVPCQSTIAVPTITALLQLQLPAGSGTRLVTERTTPAAKRNFAIANLLASAALQWAFFCDSDMVPPPDTVARLLATGCDVVGGLYAGRTFTPTGLLVYAMEAGSADRWTQPIIPELLDTLTAVDWVGAGAMLVRRPVLEALAPGPWFSPTAGEDDEDIAFCAKARRAGFAVHVDGRVHVGHLQVVPVSVRDSVQRVQTLSLPGPGGQHVEVAFR